MKAMTLKEYCELHKIAKTMKKSGTEAMPLV